MEMKTSGNNPAAASVQEVFTSGFVLSQDGTKIGYRQLGSGPGIVLVQGAMGSAHNFMQLATLLSDTFTVFAPDRRGRGMSPLPYSKEHTIQRDVEDLEALLNEKNAHSVFALSSGAVISLTAAASRASSIHKLAVFEPPLFARHPMPTVELARFDKAIVRGSVGAALTAAGKAVQVRPIPRYLPNWLLAFLTNRMLMSQDKKPKGDYLSLRELAQALRYDFRVVSQMHEEQMRWSAVKAEVLLLGGGKSPAYLKADLDVLQGLLPLAARVTFPELDHAASWNVDPQRNPKGNPEDVARELKRFFGNSPS